MTQSWQVLTAAGPPADVLLSAPVGPPADELLSAPVGPPARTVRVLRATDQAVVLGSTQPLVQIDPDRAAAAGVAVLRRRSGGGAVLVGPDLVVWVDLIIPAGDPLWEADVGRAFWWLGEAWAAALADAGVPGGRVWRGGLVTGPWSSRVCFAGCGAGEVTVDGAKVVGMAQRRSRAGALFQCAVPVTWDPAPLLGLLALDDAARAAGAVDLAHAGFGVGPDVAARLVPALLDRLP